MTRAERKELARLQRMGKLHGRLWRRFQALQQPKSIKVEKDRDFRTSLLTPHAKIVR